MAFTAQDVKELREKTGCGMMDCKKALAESDGDMEKAVEFLREKGLAAAEKKAGRIAAEGIVAVYQDNNASVIIEVNAETDFVAKNDSFKEFVNDCAKTIAEKNPCDVDALLKEKMVGSEFCVEEVLREKILTIGENMKIRRFYRTTAPSVTYVHGAGRIGVLVEFKVDGAVANEDAFVAVGRDVCMQIASMNTTYLSKDVVPADIIDKEKEILIAQIKNDEKMASKPDAVIEKMVSGRINKFYAQNCLLEQEFVKDSSMNVAGYVASKANEVGAKLEVVNFVRFEKGEGLEKREDNFADEVASMMK